MENKFNREERGVLVNQNSTAYSARKAAKERLKNQRAQSEEIESLQKQLKELKEIVNTLTLYK
tara:strand:- start:2019 stop:2207 length:189 start_codon:yes stop_codon:yes gene_type:complete